MKVATNPDFVLNDLTSHIHLISASIAQEKRLKSEQYIDHVRCGMEVKGRDFCFLPTGIYQARKNLAQHVSFRIFNDLSGFFGKKDYEL